MTPHEKELDSEVMNAPRDVNEHYNNGTLIEIPLIHSLALQWLLVAAEVFEVCLQCLMTVTQ